MRAPDPVGGTAMDRTRWRARLAAIVWVLAALLPAVPVAGVRASTPGAWTTAATMHVSREHFAAALLGDGRFLVAGGVSNGVLLRSAEIYDPGQGSWRMA